MTATTFGTFFLPGPTEVRPEILREMLRPMMSHRSAEFRAIFERIQAGMRQIFLTTRPVYISSSSATGMMEAGIRCAPAGAVLALVNGAFSERYAHIAAACGRDVTRYTVPWGELHDTAELGRLMRERHFAVVTVAHCDTSTGALNDVRAISDTAHECGAVCLIDSVSGVAGAELRFDEWNLDYVLTGSQKAIALPPGLAFAAASSGFLAGARTARERGVYFDLVEYDEHAGMEEAPNTPAISLYYALAAQVADIAGEGVEARWARHAHMAALTHEWVQRVGDRYGVGILAVPQGRSPTVTAVTLPHGITSGALALAVAEHGITIGTGYGAMKENSFRIGHMGDHTMETVSRCLAACEAALETCTAREAHARL